MRIPFNDPTIESSQSRPLTPPGPGSHCSFAAICAYVLVAVAAGIIRAHLSV
jgi:hypothetical protein